MKVVQDRKNKADKAFGDHNLSFAYKKYEEAYRKIQRIRHTKGNNVSIETELDILSQIATIALELGDYPDVHHWAARIFACEPNFLEHFYNIT